MKTLAIIGLAILAWFGLAGKKDAATAEKFVPANFNQPYNMSLDELYIYYGARYNLSWKLLKAIAQVESNERPGVKNPLDPSYGLMQLLCVPDGQGGCKNKLNVVGWPPESIQKLYDPDYSLYIASQILQWNIDRYGLLKGIAVYNAWSAHTAPQDGPFPNQGYVDKVLSKYRALGGVVSSG